MNKEPETIDQFYQRLSRLSLAELQHWRRATAVTKAIVNTTAVLALTVCLLWPAWPVIVLAAGTVMVLARGAVTITAIQAQIALCEQQRAGDK